MTAWYEVNPPALQKLRSELRQAYPTLHARISDGSVSVAGTVPIVDKGGVAIDRYSVEIKLPNNYPNSIPDVWETAGRVPREGDRHVFPKTGALCLGFPVELAITLENDLSLLNFIRKGLLPYLIGNSLVEAGQA